MPVQLPPLPTMIVGSLPQPEWLIDRDRLGHQFPPRVRAAELWRIPEQFLQEAQDDATLAAIRSQEEAGLDVLTDGEIRRESYSNHFATALDGLDLEHPGTVRNRSGHRHPGAAGRRGDPADRPGAGRRRPVPARAHRPRRQDHGARAVHDGPAGAERPLPRRPRPGPGLRRRRPRGDRRPVRGRRRHRAAGRAVAAGPAGGRAEVRRRGADPGHRGRRGAGARAPVLRLRRHGRRAARGLLLPARAGGHPGRHGVDRDGAVAPGPRHPANRCAARASPSASSTCRPRTWRPPETWRTGCGGRWTTSTSTGSCSPATAG